MKIKEFKKEITDIGAKYNLDLEVTEDEYDFCIKSGTTPLASISKSTTYLVIAGYAGYGKLEERLRRDLLNVMYKLASTPIDEREPEKKYYISSKLTPNDDGRFLFKDYDNIDSLVWGDRRCDNNTFTQDEINYIKKKFDTNLNDFNVEEVEE